MNCPLCKTYNADHLAFCQNCGYSFSEENAGGFYLQSQDLPQNQGYSWNADWEKTVLQNKVRRASPNNLYLFLSLLNLYTLLSHKSQLAQLAQRQILLHTRRQAHLKPLGIPRRQRNPAKAPAHRHRLTVTFPHRKAHNFKNNNILLGIITLKLSHSIKSLPGMGNKALIKH